MSRLVAVVVTTLLLAGGSPARSVPAPDPAPVSTRAAEPADPAVTPVRYAPPVPSPFEVVRAFEPPPDPYSAGHLGVDLAVAPGQPVRAAADGTVAFAGEVAGRGVVTIAHPDGVVTEYEPVAPLVSAGQVVALGQVIGVVSGTHGSCAPGSCLHWGARRGTADGTVYIDPLGLLTPLGPVRLLPWST